MIWMFWPKSEIMIQGILFHVTYEGRCQYKSAVLKVIMLKKNKDDS